MRVDPLVVLTRGDLLILALGAGQGIQHEACGRDRHHSLFHLLERALLLRVELGDVLLGRITVNRCILAKAPRDRVVTSTAEAEKIDLGMVLPPVSCGDNSP